MQLSITLPPSTTQTTVRELLETEWLIPRKVRHFLRTRKNVLKNNSTVMFHETVESGDKITLIFEEDDYTIPHIIPGNAKAINVLWEDDHLIIVNKPYGQKTHPNQPQETESLLNDLAAYLKPKNQIPYVVHRLDKETSGAIVFAKNPVILPVLGRLLEQKEINRHYEAEVSGLIKNKHFTINQPIGRHRHDRRKRVIDSKKGDKAITHVTVIEQLNNSTRIECQLDTGRTHQIRVHLESIHHPIIGDPLYNPTSHAKRLQLHAKSLQLIHPFTKEEINVQATPFLFD
ncbi:RluA family pseudouridine synthase [Vagococcus luciliae]|uniref:Pseudouridine synthase n=1 Tax=Vagococcus luciliae TaxID=2920380 RepID=A0ABY5NX97_9ENTE|nr:RluA family pseudouridine synthase [Vagococcus luciliae]UUV98270.1 Ribosomal large subunit pseudouridine synthase D [Vagococcus luciliae]